MKIMMVLDCGHVKLMKDNQPVYTCCYRCGSPAKVVDVTVKEWKISCAECHYGAWHGFSASLAQQAATKHAINTGHQAVHAFIAINHEAVKLRKQLIRDGLIDTR